MQDSKHPYKRLKRSPNYKARRLETKIALDSAAGRLTAVERLRGRIISGVFLGVSSIPYVTETYQKNYMPDKYLRYQAMFKKAADAVNIPYDASFHRDYVASFLGSLALTSFVSYINLTYNDHADKKQSLLMPFSLMASSLTVYEALSARLPGRSFDWGDMTCYAIALSAFTGLMYQSLKSSHKNEDNQPKLNI